MASNPAFNRLEQDARTGYAAFRDQGAPASPQAYPQQGYSQPGQLGHDQLEHMYNAPRRPRSRPAASPWTTSS